MTLLFQLATVCAFLIALFVLWAAAPLHRLVRLEERVDEAIKVYNKRFKQLEDDLTDWERGGNPGYRENANPSTASEDEPQPTKPSKPFVYGQKVDVFLDDDGYDDAEHPNRPAFTATFLGFSKVGSTTTVTLQIGDQKGETFVLSDIELFHPEAP